LTIENRKQAISTACKLAAANDVILIAGKGHEKYQEINGVRHPFDDKEILRIELG
jgi:UDP-N-acetylmuramoyl-L-alanyl-D-glutamate--2,6-diaminopimelate ligase